MTAAPAPDRVALTALSLKDFRNYTALNLAVSASLIVLSGPNGAGKTNLLEAISLLTPGRGLRRAAYSEISRHGSETGWAVAASIRRNGAEARIGTGFAGSAGEAGGRRVRVNGADATAEMLLDYLRVLWLTPAMDGLFDGPASERRRFLDRLVLAIDPGHGGRARNFERLLTQRNRLLAEGGQSGWLDALEAQLAENAVAIALARSETVGLLSHRLQAQDPQNSAFPTCRIELDGSFDRAIAGRGGADAESWYRAGLAAGRAADRAAGRALEGPHRSDLAVIFAEKGVPASLSSTGEQKALLIGLILAHAALVAEVSGMTPLLLLDEVAAHLDPARRTALFDRLGELGCQTFLTGADPSIFAALGGSGRIFHVANDIVEPPDGQAHP